MLAKYKHIEAIPKDPNKIPLGLGRATTLIENLQSNYKDALLFRELSTQDRCSAQGKPCRFEVAGSTSALLRKVCKGVAEESIIDRVTSMLNISEIKEKAMNKTEL